MTKLLQTILALFATLVITIGAGSTTDLPTDTHENHKGESYGESIQEYNDLDPDDISQ